MVVLAVALSAPVFSKRGLEEEEEDEAPFRLRWRLLPLEGGIGVGGGGLRRYRGYPCTWAFEKKKNKR